MKIIALTLALAFVASAANAASWALVLADGHDIYILDDGLTFEDCVSALEADPNNESLWCEWEQ